MEVNQIKKALYKEKPIASRLYMIEKGQSSGTVFYKTKSSLGKHLFSIPKNEAEDFGEQEPAQLLIRWLIV